MAKKPTIKKSRPVETKTPKGRAKPNMNYNRITKAPPKSNKKTPPVKKARPMSPALRKLYERLDDWQFAGRLPYDTYHQGVPDPYPISLGSANKRTY